VATLALPDSTPLQGGIPIRLDGKVIGAIGVSGDTPPGRRGHRLGRRGGLQVGEGRLAPIIQHRRFRLTISKLSSSSSNQARHEDRLELSG